MIYPNRVVLIDEMKRLLLAFYSMGLLIFPSIIYSQQWDLRGQLTSSINLFKDPIAKNTEIDQRVGYIPTLSIYPEYKYLSRIDFEAAFNIQASFDGFFGTGENGIDNNNDIHRLWGRYNSDNIELRYGIQKIAFGPGLILRPLRWFDSLDPKDPTGQTDGVTALRLKYFGGHGVTYWGWYIHPENRELSSRGGRIEFQILGLGDLGVSYHHRPAYSDNNIPLRSGIALVYPTSSEDRYSLDFRADVVVGIWSEILIAKSSQNKFVVPFDRNTFMIGGDYTFPIGNGIYFLMEHMIDEVKPKAILNDMQTKFSAIMVNYPIGVFDNITLITEYDWEDKRQFNFVKYSRIYDNYDFNLIIAFNPERDEFSDEELELSGLAQFGNNIQLMIIFNH